MSEAEGNEENARNLRKKQTILKKNHAWKEKVHAEGGKYACNW